MAQTRSILAALVLLVLSAWLPSAVSAQTTTGGFSGIVSGDQSVLVGAQVQIKSTTTGATRVVTTGTDGRYFVTGLDIGNYEVTARRIGFAPETKTQAVSIGQTARVDFTLTPQASQLSSVLVRGATSADQISPTRMGAQTTLTDSALASHAVAEPKLHGFRRRFAAGRHEGSRKLRRRTEQPLQRHSDRRLAGQRRLRTELDAAARRPGRRKADLARSRQGISGSSFAVRRSSGILLRLHGQRRDEERLERACMARGRTLCATRSSSEMSIIFAPRRSRRSRKASGSAARSSRDKIFFSIAPEFQQENQRRRAVRTSASRQRRLRFLRQRRPRSTALPTFSRPSTASPIRERRAS